VTAQPGSVHADVHDGRVAAELAVEDFAIEDITDPGLLSVDAHVEVEDGLPQGWEIDDVALVAEIFLGDLQLDGHVCVSERREERGRGFADLKVDGTVLDLHDDVVVELAVEFLEELDSGVGSVAVPVCPVGKMVCFMYQHGCGHSARGSRMANVL
jgi:hypothetical protein